MPNGTEPKQHIIEIIVSGTPQALSYAAAYAGDPEWKRGPETRVKPHDRVQWICKGGDYTIQFENEKSPFDPPELRLSSTSGKSTTWYNVRPRKGSTDDRHKYTVDVGHGALIDDPVIIVEDG